MGRAKPMNGTTSYRPKAKAKSTKKVKLLS